jgi:hypothetical protein
LILKILLEIETGAQNWITVGDLGSYSSAMAAHWSVVKFSPRDWHNRSAEELRNSLDDPINQIHWSKELFAELLVVDQYAYGDALRYLVELRSLCRQHPACRLNVQ